MAYIKMGITLREAPKIADALDEYRQRHLELPSLFSLRFGQLAAELRDASERGLAREAEQESKRWGKH